MARRRDALADAANDAGAGSLAVTCDVTDEASCRDAVEQAAEQLGRIDGLVYATGVGPLARIETVDAATWQRVFATNVVGAALVTAAALPHLRASAGTAVYFSSVSASQTAPWPGLGAYAVSKAALDKLVEAWRAEHPGIGFSRLVIGDCAGGEGDAATQFASNWDVELAGELMPQWLEQGLMTGTLLPVERLVDAVETVLRKGGGAVPSLVVAPMA
jgi:NAD(P)-dependent dehydrogenase (short-subunit alcohol dehydrogenase family)